MDALSEVLRSFRLKGSIYCAWDLAAPWGMAITPARNWPFHFIQAGKCVLIRKDGQRVALEGGDVVALFDGAQHRLCDSSASRVEPLERILAARPKDNGVYKYGGTGAACRMICGKFMVDEHESAPVTLRHLPALVHIRHQDSKRVASVAATMDLLGAEVRGQESGAQRAASLLTEILLIHVFRMVLSDEDAGASPGWVAGLRDPQIAIALAAIHGEPEHPWSVDSLATRAGLSRSVFAERFAARLGRTPMSYLADWRLRIAGRLLRETELSVSEICQRLGYGSAASFDRAFKRSHRLSPSAYRRRFAAAA